ncbi:hypothetical protein PENCOP_c003G06642 [Penicillium coprophilum]|uniref:Zn(2)-C6 fungal-type domain-containing protein n=1 Tax=Penicillium coprophilum TaxID=36646 RepID=A0A1V6UZU6_9EURO|nr:hypothetical protein PENCOP_c003G06642 [Penicillium coprophilum]
MSSARESSTTQKCRISKACEACRSRKSRCNGATPCSKCTERPWGCVYRAKPRHRPKKNQLGQDPKSLPSASAAPVSHMSSQPMWEGLKDSALAFNSVTATHLASPGLMMQLYYGPTSHFSLMQTIYQDLIPGYGQGQAGIPATGVEEENAGLDMFKFRDIFFGISDSNAHAETTSYGRKFASPIFVPYPVAKALLFRFLETLYHLMPFRPQEVYQRDLDELYQAPYGLVGGASGQVLLMAIAIAALNTQHYRLADILFEFVNDQLATMTEIVNLEMVQASLMMISSDLFPTSLDQTLLT